MGRTKKSKKGSVSITTEKDNPRLRWRHFGKRFSLNISGTGSISHIKSKQVAVQIEQDILLGNFDPNKMGLKNVEKFHLLIINTKNTFLKQLEK